MPFKALDKEFLNSRGTSFESNPEGVFSLALDDLFLEPLEAAIHRRLKSNYCLENFSFLKEIYTLNQRILEGSITEAEMQQQLKKIKGTYIDGLSELPTINISSSTKRELTTAEPLEITSFEKAIKETFSLVTDLQSLAFPSDNRSLTLQNLGKEVNELRVLKKTSATMLLFDEEKNPDKFYARQLAKDYLSLLGQNIILLENIISSIAPNLPNLQKLVAELKKTEQNLLSILHTDFKDDSLPAKKLQEKIATTFSSGAEKCIKKFAELETSLVTGKIYSNLFRPKDMGQLIGSLRKVRDELSLEAEISTRNLIQLTQKSIKPPIFSV